MRGASRRKVAPQPAIQSTHIAAPTGGINTVNPAPAMPPSDAVLLYNMVAAEYGLRSRLGWKEWCTNLTGAADNKVREVLPFTGSVATKNRLFATTTSGIWDCSSSTDAPTLALSFAATTGDAGRGVCCVMVTAAGHFLLYADEVNGLHVYTESSDTWAAVAMGSGGSEIDGVDPADIVFVAVFKDRVWMVERDSTNAWYLDSGAVYGTAAALNLGYKFRAGGYLVALANWTYDGGNGLDDSLVAISAGGDVAIYQGTDPTSASTFGLKGVWYTGAPPAGRHITTNFGGDVAMLTRTGIVPLSLLVMGPVERSQYTTYKISNLFNAAMLTGAGYEGWRLCLHPEDATLLVTVPTSDGGATEQLAMALTPKSWSRYRDLPMLSCEAWEGQLYFGTTDGRVCVNTGYVDGILLADASASTPVQWAVLTAFQNLGNGNNKQAQSIRPYFLSEAGEPSFSVDARYDFDFSELAPISAGMAGGETWDNAIWDSALWAGDYSPTLELRGAVGMGHNVAIALRGTATARTVLTGMDVYFTAGGPL